MASRIIISMTIIVLVLVSLLGCGGDSEKSLAPTELSMTGGTLPVAITNEAYSHTITVSGGKINYEFELDHDLLPPGIIAEWVDNDLVFHGTPTQTGTYTIPVTVIDSYDDTDMATFIIEVADTVALGGTWNMVITVTVGGGDCAGEEGVYPGVSVNITQAGSAVTVSGFLGDPGNVLTGSVSGTNDEVITISGSYPEDGGTTTATHIWTRTSPTTMTGTESWSWTDGILNCPGSQSTVVCNKVSK